jgi:2-oxoglutarate dehydrogenase E1 component
VKRLTLLLPHGYEGAGPEHSSARIERFLALAAEGNIRIANPTTAAQYFHLLRRQALVKKARPLVVFTPKSLLRLERASSALSELTDDHFHYVLDDPAAAERCDRVERLALCSGKIYHEIDASERRGAAENVAIARVELLYPFARDQLSEVISSYPNLKEILWVQEEPKNMGAWNFVHPRLEALARDDQKLRYVGRPERASPAEGMAELHEMEQHRIVTEAFEGAPVLEKTYGVKHGD